MTEKAALIRHLLTAPVSPADYIFGKCLSVLVVSMLGFFFLVVVGIAAGVDWGAGYDHCRSGGGGFFGVCRSSRIDLQSGWNRTAGRCVIDDLSSWCGV